MNKQTGFTLIELVVVIIILGILAVAAAPKFVNLQGDARVSTLQGMKTAIQGANSLVYSKATITSQEELASHGTATVPAVNIGTGTAAVTNFGYLQATVTELENALDATFSKAEDTQSKTAAVVGDWTISATSGTPKLATIGIEGGASECSFTYTEAKDKSTPPVFGSMPAASDC